MATHCSILACDSMDRRAWWAAILVKSLQLCSTLRPHGQQPTRPLCPQDSLGKEAGVVPIYLKYLYQGFPGGPGIKNPHCIVGSEPWSGRIPHAMKQ